MAVPAPLIPPSQLVPPQPPVSTSAACTTTTSTSTAAAASPPAGAPPATAAVAAAAAAAAAAVAAASASPGSSLFRPEPGVTAAAAAGAPSSGENGCGSSLGTGGAPNPPAAAAAGVVGAGPAGGVVGVVAASAAPVAGGVAGKPVYSTPSPVENTPQNNECKMVELRGAKVASFTVEGCELICLPQAFDLFLKHLVGGLHTVYTKLKRLEITPVVCNVEQVRILRGLGAIQPGVNRCKLISRKDFETLYNDCTNARSELEEESNGQWSEIPVADAVSSIPIIFGWRLLSVTSKGVEELLKNSQGTEPKKQIHGKH
ncbi:UNVERIFIED_CONTAM: hypothetical protein K2H54_028981 [Gekko kuhli]